MSAPFPYREYELTAMRECSTSTVSSEMTKPAASPAPTAMAIALDATDGRRRAIPMRRRRRYARVSVVCSGKRERDVRARRGHGQLEHADEHQENDEERDQCPCARLGPRVARRGAGDRAHRERRQDEREEQTTEVSDRERPERRPDLARGEGPVQERGERNDRKDVDHADERVVDERRERGPLGR